MKWILASQVNKITDESRVFKHTGTGDNCMGQFFYNEVEIKCISIWPNGAHNGYVVEDKDDNFSNWMVLDETQSPSPEGWVSVEIEFGSHLRCMLSFSGDELKIDGAVNGWGNPVTADEIKITKLPKPPKQ